jgi:hypothetical protein
MTKLPQFYSNSYELNPVRVRNKFISDSVKKQNILPNANCKFKNISSIAEESK